MNKEKIDKSGKRVRVVATPAFTLLAFCFKKLIGGIKAMARWLADKACVVINQLKEKAKKQKSTSESCGHDPSTCEKLCPSSGTKAQQPQKEEVAAASTSSGTPEKSESEADHGSCRVKTSTHGLRPKKDSLNLVNGATALPLRKGSRFATTTASGETTSSIPRKKSGFDWFDFFVLGVGLTIVGELLSYGINYGCLTSRFGQFLFVSALNGIPMIVITSSMLAWALYLGMSSNGRRGFINVFIGWLVTTIITIIVWSYMLNDSLGKADRFQSSSQKESQSSYEWHPSLGAMVDVD